MIIANFSILRWSFVVFWYGWLGWLEDYRWGLVGNRWPTIWAGPLKIVWGPR